MDTRHGQHSQFGFADFLPHLFLCISYTPSHLFLENFLKHHLRLWPSL